MRKRGEDISILSDKNCKMISDPDIGDPLELPVVLLLQQGGAHLRPAGIHVEDVLPPAPRECEDRWGREGLLEPVERLLLQWRGQGH